LIILLIDNKLKEEWSK